MNNYTAVLTLSLVVAGLLGFAAILNFTADNAFSGALLALGAALFAAAGFMVHAKGRSQRAP